MKENSAKHFSNRSCQYYPCHKMREAQNAGKKEETEDFNCLFCYCPLYALGDNCGGNFCYTDKGIKDCTNCSIPHGEGGYEYVMEHIRGVIQMTRRQDCKTPLDRRSIRNGEKG